MAGKKEAVIALLGQPNSGKSTLFNQLTGSKQHVGNWAGKTVEKKEGFFEHNGISYKITDLPGSYSLVANSEEEIVTRDYIASGVADVVCILVDASQLERSMYMAADFAGIQVPAVLVLNMMDVARSQGKKIDVKKIEEELGIPVIPFVAAEKKQYVEFYRGLERALEEKRLLRTEKLEKEYERMFGNDYIKFCAQMPQSEKHKYSSMWLAIKCLEGDEPVLKEYQDYLSYMPEEEDASIQIADAKYAWIQGILQTAVVKKKQGPVMGKFDRLATSKRWGKWIALGVILLALSASMLIAEPITIIAGMIPELLQPPLKNFLERIHTAPFLVSLISSLVPNILLFAVNLSGYVIGITFVFSLIEEVGYMARISFVFDGLMSRLGLQGKSIMAFFMGVGCTVGGTTGTRVIDNWGQRVLAMALVWAVPCGATWSVMPSLANMFFGPAGAMLVMLAIVLVMFLVMAVTAYFFRGKLAPKEQRVGMIMEMPPYHKPRWGFLLRTTFSRTKDIFLRALRVIFIVSLIFWCLAYSKDGDVTSSIIYKVGTVIEPVTRIFGLGWQSFMAFVASICSKEAILGVLSSLYVSGSSVFEATMEAENAVGAADLSAILPTAISKAEALAFIFATTFNMPCVMALASTYKESHSLKWTVRIAVFYTVIALLVSCLVYRVGVMIF